MQPQSSLFFQTLLNQQQMYWISAVPMYIILFTSALLAFRVSGGQFGKVIDCLKCSKINSAAGQSVEVDAN